MKEKSDVGLMTIQKIKYRLQAKAEIYDAPTYENAKADRNIIEKYQFDLRKYLLAEKMENQME